MQQPKYRLFFIFHGILSIFLMFTLYFMLYRFYLSVPQSGLILQMPRLFIHGSAVLKKPDRKNQRFYTKPLAQCANTFTAFPVIKSSDF